MNWLQRIIGKWGFFFSLSAFNYASAALSPTPVVAWPRQNQRMSTRRNLRVIFAAVLCAYADTVETG